MAEIQIRRIGDVMILPLNGKFGGQDQGGGEIIDSFVETIKRLVAEGNVKIVVDMEKVSLMNGSGLGALLFAMTSLKNTGRDLKLVKPSDKVKNFSDTVGVTTRFSIFNTVDDAVASFEKGHN